MFLCDIFVMFSWRTYGGRPRGTMVKYAPATILERTGQSKGYEREHGTGTP